MRKRRGGMQWSSQGPFDLSVERSKWVPFFSTALFLPRLKIRLRNTGEHLHSASLTVDVAAYSGPIGDIATATASGELTWQDVKHYNQEQDWKPGETRTFKPTIESRFLPGPGTYVLRISLIRWEPHEISVHEDVRSQLEQAEIPEEKQREILGRLATHLAPPGIDVHAPRPGQMKGENAYTANIHDFIRVEPFSTVLNFGLVVGTFLLSIATLSLAWLD